MNKTLPEASPFTGDEIALLRDALTHYKDSRLKIARRRDRQEGGSGVERALADFFRMCEALDVKLLVAIRGY